MRKTTCKTCGQEGDWFVKYLCDHCGTQIKKGSGGVQLTVFNPLTKHEQIFNACNGKCACQVAIKIQQLEEQWMKQGF